METKIYDAGGNEIHEYKYSEIFKSDKIELCGKTYIFDQDKTAEILPGDTYLAERYTGIRVGVCKENDKKNRQIVPETNDIPCYFPQECRRVILVIS